METFKQYLPLCWFSANPLDLPRSVRFLQQNLWFYFGLELFIQINMIDDIEAFFEVTLETGLTMSFAAIILLLNKSMHAYVQVTSSILFCENVVAVFVLPVMLWLTVTDSEISYLLMLLLIIWDFSLVSYVCKRVLGINKAAACVMAFFYFCYTYGLAYGLTTLVMG